MVLLEALGEKEFKRRVKIYATDVEERALATAREAVYLPEALGPVPQELVKRYFVEKGGGLAFRSDLRRSVIFGRNELLEDAPISRIDLLICRNVLMYFTVEAQARILSQFNFALRDRGFLFLGKSEMLTRHSEFFAPVEVKWRVFRRLPRRHLGERLNEVIGGTPCDGRRRGSGAALRRSSRRGRLGWAQWPASSSIPRVFLSTRTTSPMTSSRSGPRT